MQMGLRYRDGQYGTMCHVSTAYELTGRTRQKARTHNALIAAARELLAEGRLPTVEEAADRADVLRRMGEGAPPGLVLAAVPADGEGFELIQDIRRHPTWQSVPLIALAEGELSPAEIERLRGQVRRVVWSGDDPPDELIAELRRIAADSAVPTPKAKAPEAAAAPEPAAAIVP